MISKLNVFIVVFLCISLIISNASSAFMKFDEMKRHKSLDSNNITSVEKEPLTTSSNPIRYNDNKEEIEYKLNNLILDIDKLNDTNLDKEIIKLVQLEKYILGFNQFIIIVNLAERKLIIDQERVGLLFSNIDNLKLISGATLGYEIDSAIRINGSTGSFIYPWPNRNIQKLVNKVAVYKLIPTKNLLVGIGYYPE